MNHAKEEARKLIESLPENSSWNDIISALYINRKLMESLEAAQKRRTIPHEEVKRRFPAR